MASHLAQGRLMIQDENIDIHHKNFVVDGTSRSSKPASKKGGAGFGSRKALNDITNKSSIHHEASSRKTNLPKEKFNIAEEMFLHDHKKCIEAQLKVTEPCFWDTVLPGHDSVSQIEDLDSSQAKTDLDGPQCYPEPVELSMSEFSDWLAVSTQWRSPPSSPSQWDSQPSSPFAWELEPVHFVFKEEDDC
ncbi:protein PATRONUS 2-like [Actinidia eriantha]|uniref:protein PATRONUS 2-like n=1 Tax=Actinidia eriantha TaxID=165200 RepID=UPI002586E39D|nr:protein PATRONUS 2-like [Actinidia eriantha]